MRYKNTKIKRIFALSALALPMLAFGGNIPQYKVEKGTAKYAEFTDGTEIPCKWASETKVIFPGGYEAINAYSAVGFPIGFDFRFGGRVFDQFVVSSAGNIYLGKDKVNYLGDAFTINMSPIMYGLKKATISYRVSGEEGNRVLEIQFKDAILNETSKYPGKYSLQFRLYEADGKVELALKELNTVVVQYFGFNTSLTGYDAADRLGITADGLEKPFTVFTGKGMDILEPSTYLHWDADDFDMDYQPVFVFTPDNNPIAPEGGPSALQVKQNEKNLVISCQRGATADATVILLSEQPFTDADLPRDGETFRAGMDSDGQWHTTMGNAIALYYGNDEQMEIEYPGIKSGKDYHVCAISANGYPAFNRNERVEQVVVTSQAAPDELSVSSDAPDAISLYCRSDYRVIIASTTENRKEFGAGYVGIFGIPSADVQVGDALPEGGTVVYVGDSGTSVNVDALPNQLTYFRAWTVAGDRVSAMSVDGVGIPTPSFPYSPVVENYPLNERLWGWQHSDETAFIPVERQNSHDRALCTTSINDTEYTVTTPSFISTRDMTLTFEFAMETEKDAATGEEGQVMMQGFEPGKFYETGYFRIFSGEDLLKEIREYNGTMKGVSTGGYEDGTSTFEEAEVEVPATDGPQTLTFAFSTPKKSRLYLRNITLLQTGPISGIESVATDADIRESDAAVYTLTGLRIEGRGVDELPAGLYIVGGKKVVVGK